MSTTTHVRTHTSATAIELGDRLTRLILGFRDSHGAVTDTDVRHALRIAEKRTGVTLQRGTISVIMTGVILMATIVYLLIDVATSYGNMGLSQIAPLLALMGLGLVFVYLAAQR